MGNDEVCARVEPLGLYIASKPRGSMNIADGKPDETHGPHPLISPDRVLCLCVCVSVPSPAPVGPLQVRVYPVHQPHYTYTHILVQARQKTRRMTAKSLVVDRLTIPFPCRKDKGASLVDQHGADGGRGTSFDTQHTRRASPPRPRPPAPQAQEARRPPVLYIKLQGSQGQSGRSPRPRLVSKLFRLPHPPLAHLVFSHLYILYMAGYTLTLPSCYHTVI